MPILLTINLAIKALLTNKNRALLTMLGIIIGIASVIIIISAGQGAKAMIMKELEGFNANVISATPGKIGIPGTATNMFKKRYFELAEKPGTFKYIVSSIPVVIYTGFVSYKQNIKSFSTVGTTPNAFEIMGYEIEKGRTFTNFDEKSSSNVLVLGGKTAKDLFIEENPVGKTVKINKQNWKVIGVLKEKGGLGLFDNYILGPFSSIANRLMNSDSLDEWDFVAVDKDSVNLAKEEVRLFLRDKLNLKQNDEEPFLLTTAEEGLNIINNVLFYLTTFLTLIAAISLLVGGIGIMNIMLVSVTERTKEIGLRKAVGAKYKDILQQFLVESVILCLIGGIIGIILGGLGTKLISAIAKWPFEISLWTILISVGICTGTGIIFGYYPARKAALLDPIEALRSE